MRKSDMKEIEQELLDCHVDCIDPDSNWIKTNLPDELNDTGAKDFIIEPHDAKSVNQVNSFTIQYEIKGKRIIKFTRGKQ
jgi:hypothetical protein